MNDVKWLSGFLALFWLFNVSAAAGIAAHGVWAMLNLTRLASRTRLATSVYMIAVHPGGQLPRLKTLLV